jgi:hypothetical protein
VRALGKVDFFLIAMDSMKVRRAGRGFLQKAQNRWNRPLEPLVVKNVTAGHFFCVVFF